MKAVLLLDNATTHLPAEESKILNGKFFVIYTPPNVTSLIRPMNRNELRLIALFYSKSLLNYLITKRETFCICLQKFESRDAVIDSQIAWPQLTLQ